jgi:hypothetical protein
MTWTAWLLIGGAVCCGLVALGTIAMLGMVAMGRRCPASRLAECSKLTIRFRDDDREVQIDDPATVAEVASHLTDERKPALEQADTWVELCFIESETRKYEVLATPFGWCWPMEKSSSRDLTDEAAFVELIERLGEGNPEGVRDEQA